MAVTAIRTLILYICIVAAMRIMGKRQLGELQPNELVVTLLIADLAAVPMQESGMPLLQGILPIAVLVALELILSVLMLKWPFFSRAVSGHPRTVIRDGDIDRSALRALRVTVEDLNEALRQQGVFEIRDVSYAIIETNGKLSVWLKAEQRSATVGDLQGVESITPDDDAPILIVSDGHIIKWALDMLSQEEAFVYAILRAEHCSVKDVFLLTADKSGRYYLLRKGEHS